ncbi:GEVED domain-containing protein [Vicingaceae bacterium]|nr:GEVED domain-containing protein [Vicingaceae bacterium]
MRNIIKALSILFITSVSAQSSGDTKVSYKEMMYDPSYNFYEVVEAAEEYFSTVDKTAKGSGYKPFMRWVSANEYKFYPEGERANVNPYLAELEYKRFLKSSPNNKSLFGSSWRDLGPYTLDSITGHYAAGLGRVEDLYVSPTDSNVLYLGSRSGGFWRTTNGGATWNTTTDFLFASGVNTMTVSPTNSDSVLINVRNASNGNSHGVYQSTDGGLNWSVTGLSPASYNQLVLGNNVQVDDIAYHPRIKNLVFVGTNRGIFKSTDNLATWTAAQFNFDFIEIAFHPTNDSIVYLYSDVGTNVADRIFISTDLGNTWSLSNVILGNNGNRRVELATSPQCADCIWFASNNGVWISTDRGTNFSFRSNSPQSCGGFAVNDLDTSNMVYGYLDLDNSTNGGNTFIRRTRWSLGNTNGNTSSNSTSYSSSTNYIHADVRDLEAVNGNFYAATDGFLCKSTDGGVSWTILSEGTGIRENYKLGVSQSNHYRSISGSQDNGTSILTEQGWVEHYGADGMESLIHPLNQDWMMGSVQYGNRRLTKNGGFTSSGASPSGSTQAYWEAPLAYDPNDHMTIFDFRNEVWKSDDFTATYTQLANPGTINGDIQHAEIAQINSDIIVVARGSAIEKSTDGGVSFSNIRSNLPNASIRDIAFDPNNDNVIIVVYARYQTDNSKVWLTTNGGSSWTNITHNLGSMPILSVVFDHTDTSNIYLGAEIGVYTMPMGSSSWSLYNTGLPNMSVKELEVMYGTNTLRAATWGRGLWEYALVGRNSYPSIVYTEISNTPTENNPKMGVDQYVTSKIKYPTTLSSVYVEWSRDSAVFGNSIAMTNTIDSTWVSNSPLPQFPVGTKVYFKVFAVGTNSDTTETYKFMYTVVPFENCVATGNTGSGNLFIDNVTIENVNNTSGNTGYLLYANPVLDLYIDSTYTLDISANTGWGLNDFGAWIDFNGDADFTVSERVLFDPNSGGGSINSFTVPSTALVGDTVTLRVRLSYWSDPEPCGNQFGEVEDYKVFLRNTTTSLGVLSVDNEFFRIYPNPNNGQFTIEISDDLKERKISILNSTGSLVAEKLLNGKRTSLFQLDLPKGIYFIRLENSNKGLRFIVQY